MNSILVLIAVVLIVAAFSWYLYNSIIVARMRVSEALSQIDVQLKEGRDLIPNLVATVTRLPPSMKKKFLGKCHGGSRQSLVSAKEVRQRKRKPIIRLSQTLKIYFSRLPKLIQT